MAMTRPSTKQLLFGPRTVTALGVLLLIGIGLRLLAWAFGMPTLAAIGMWLTIPFLLMLALLLLVVLPYTWFTSRGKN